MHLSVQSIKQLYFVGIKGVAMTSLAIFAKEKGYQIAGSDTEEIFPTQDVLLHAHIPIHLHFFPSHILQCFKPDLVIYTGAHNGRENPEVQEALRLGIPVLPHGQALGLFMDPYVQISVCGSHGKTTTSAMIATLLTYAKCDPSYAVGCGEIFDIGRAGHFGKGNIFIAEADEYVTDPKHDMTPRFLWQHPDILVATNIDYDHPDVYASLRDVQRAFIDFQKQQKGRKVTIVNADDPSSKILLQNSNHSIITYGISPKADMRITHIRYGSGQTFFSLEYGAMNIGDFTLFVAGKHNVMNATAAVTSAYVIGIPVNKIRQSLLHFKGTKRRFELVGRRHDISIYDDYAHHPCEIEATLDAARHWFPKRRIISIFQPHTYSRTKALLSRFAKSFLKSDIALFTDIYASARETANLDITTETLVEKAQKLHVHAVYTKDFDHTEKHIMRIARTGDIVIFMGAGNIYEWGKKILQNL